MNSTWNRFYEIDGLILDMGEGHTLPETQRSFPMYDRFIPYLGKLAVQSPEDAPKWIVDIGANVGDTVAALVRHTTAHILCVEPTNKFFQLCQKNIANFGDEFVSRVQLVKAYIAQNIEDNYISSVRGGTAVKIKTDGVAESPTYTIPQLLKKFGIAPEDLAIVKVDTDGYDAECIMSLGETLQQISPLLYWENQINDDNQLQKYLSVVDYLFDNGYTDFFVFDNFGNYLAPVSATGLKEINRYLGRMMHQRSARTFFCVDVLACKPESRHACQSAISNYLRKIEKPVHNTSADYQAIIQDFCLTDTGLSITVRNTGSVDWTYAERTFAYAAQSEGYYPAFLMNDIYARIEFTNLEIQKLGSQQMAAWLHASQLAGIYNIPAEQILKKMRRDINPARLTMESRGA